MCGIAGVVSHMLYHKLSVEETTYIYIDRDDDIDSVMRKIGETNCDASLTAFDWLTAYSKYDEHIRPGRYEVNDTMTTMQLFRDLRNHHSKPIMMVVPSVRTLDLMASRLALQLMIDSTEIATLFQDSVLWAKMGYTKASFPSLFIPNTYEVYWETTAENLIDRLGKEHDKFWNTTRTEQANQIGLTPEEVATLASIVDSETANDAEKPRIAGLYINRLNRGIPLQSDPTVIYAVGDFSIRRVLNAHLLTPSPYNTYLNKGLPPGPIRIPSIAGINAVLNYEHHDYLYMCAKEDFSGTHNFATTYAEHMANARRYTQALNKRGILR